MKQLVSICRTLRRALPSMRRTMAFALGAVFCVSASGVAWAAPKEMSDGELAAVSGQGLLTLSNSSAGGLNFSTLTFNSDITLNANFQNIVLGQYGATSRNGASADINIPVLQFGRTDASTAQQTVQITDPYVEFVYNNSGGAGNGQVVGMRLGFNGISGDVGLLMSDISGSLQIADGSAGTLHTDSSRSTTACLNQATCIPLSQIGGVTAGNASGPSRDFWISMLSQPVQFPAQAGMSAPSVAAAGFWLNWTDRLVALNTGGLIPANVAMAMLRH